MSNSSPSIDARHARGRGQRIIRRQLLDIWTPRSPAHVLSVLTAELGSEQISSMELGPRDSGRGDRVRSFRVISRDAVRSPWRFVFEGSIRAQEGGTLLTGDVGPSQTTLILVLGWLSVVALFFVSGVVSVAVGLMSGQRTLDLSWLLIPAGLLIASFAIHRAAAKSADVRWRATERWLRDIVDGQESL